MPIPTLALSMFSASCTVEIRQIRTAETCTYACFDVTGGELRDMECSGFARIGAALDALLARYPASDFDADLSDLREQAAAFEATHGMDWLVADEDLAAWLRYDI